MAWKRSSVRSRPGPPKLTTYTVTFSAECAKFLGVPGSSIYHLRIGFALLLPDRSGVNIEGRADVRVAQ